VTVAALIGCVLSSTGVDVAGQGLDAPRGSAASTWGGIVLGAYSGTVLGLLGTMMPCNRTLAGGGCAAAGAGAGAAFVLSMGGIVGGQNEDEVVARLRSAGWGSAAGALVGLAVWRGVRQYGWTDALAVAAVGGALGAAPVGSGLGATVGATAGAVTWWMDPDRGLPNLVMLTLAGVMVGGIVDWGLAAANANDQPPLAASFSIPVG
jgi:hypothetical protein